MCSHCRGAITVLIGFAMLWILYDFFYYRFRRLQHAIPMLWETSSHGCYRKLTTTFRRHGDDDLLVGRQRLDRVIDGLCRKSLYQGHLLLAKGLHSAGKIAISGISRQRQYQKREMRQREWFHVRRR
jgi:hypothetical protein